MSPDGETQFNALESLLHHVESDGLQGCNLTVTLPKKYIQHWSGSSYEPSGE